MGSGSSRRRGPVATGGGGGGDPRGPGAAPGPAEAAAGGEGAAALPAPGGPPREVPGKEQQAAGGAAGRVVRLRGGGADGQHRAGVRPLSPRRGAESCCQRTTATPRTARRRRRRRRRKERMGERQHDCSRGTEGDLKKAHLAIRLKETGGPSRSVTNPRAAQRQEQKERPEPERRGGPATRPRTSAGERAAHRREEPRLCSHTRQEILCCQPIRSSP
ncbi:cystin-1 isoform X3 [Anser cygnoides]|uniref:cystin-1 isoform X3 n=1 Tax=Anser cygnoides TaxID=8845 RepID=UPI0034D30565